MRGQSEPIDQNRYIAAASQRTISLGDIEISYIPDGYVELEPTRWFQTTNLDSSFRINSRGYLTASVGSIVVHESDGDVVIDAGLGDFQAPHHLTHPSLGRMMGGQNPGFFSSFKRPIKAIAVTHAHEDHLGWLRADLGSQLSAGQYFVGLPDADRFAHVTGIRNVSTIRGGESLSAHVKAIATPGHTAGHMSYSISSQGESAVVIGDVFHHHAQLKNPDLTPWSDEIPSVARKSRDEVLALLKNSGVIGIGGHFADVVFGKWVDREWIPVPS